MKINKIYIEFKLTVFSVAGKVENQTFNFLEWKKMFFMLFSLVSVACHCQLSEDPFMKWKIRLFSSFVLFRADNEIATIAIFPSLMIRMSIRAQHETKISLTQTNYFSLDGNSRMRTNENEKKNHFHPFL